jgi:hypothetical protein
MKKIDSFLLALLWLALSTASVPAQTTSSPVNPADGGTLVQTDAGIAPIFPQMFEQITSAGLFNEKFVKNQPAAAVFEAKTVRFQSNGASAVTKHVLTRIYRDSQGRTRREQVAYTGGASIIESANPDSIIIEDPVSGFTYLLNSASRTAFRYKLPPIVQQGAVDFDSVPLVVDILRTDSRETNSVKTYRLEPPLRENLGNQQITGVGSEGRRLRFKIPIGALGNAAEVETTHETWVARDMKMLVKSITRNPLVGEHLLRLISLSRSEQPVTLFEVPAGYTIQESGKVRTDLPPPR